MTGSSSFRAVGFDLDGTLYRPAPMKRRMALELGLLPLRAGPWRARRVVSVLRTFRRLHEEIRAGLPRHGVPLDRFHHEEAARRCGESAEFVVAVVGEWMRERPLRHLAGAARPGLVECLRGLRDAGLAVGVLSDYPAAAKLKALGIHGLVDAVVAATDPEVEALKPSPRGFERLAERLGVAPDQALYVGDRAEVDGAGARAAGWGFQLVGDRADAGAGGTLGDVLERALAGRG